MNAKQYLPFSIAFKAIPVIIYPAKDDGDITKAFSRTDAKSIEDYLLSVFSIFEDIIAGADLLICYVWNDIHIPMVDIWKVSRNTISDDSGFLYDCFILRDKEMEKGMGMASGNSLIVLASEEILLRKLIINEGKSFLEASDRSKYFPEFPQRLTPEESFYNANT